ncbi:MAG: type II toxin-antitoxin system HicB family antitoxin [Legionella sp.]|uniref:type II toxin-antitoxin system HicB family antitoxin n=1 Tax=Legionella sp. TaxID=459 RepID=UPI002849F61F|nr:type II toxin-antitoxin system HicB family antitoxin [Legionella sp.]
MKHMLKYKGYYGSIEFDADDLLLYGKLEFINSLISYEGETTIQIDAAFKEAVDDYLLTCKERGVEPEKPFKGSLNVRIGPERHARAAFVAKELGSSLNEFFNMALDHEFERHKLV